MNTFSKWFTIPVPAGVNSASLSGTAVYDGLRSTASLSGVSPGAESTLTANVTKVTLYEELLVPAPGAPAPSFIPPQAALASPVAGTMEWILQSFTPITGGATIQVLVRLMPVS